MEPDGTAQSYGSGKADADGTVTIGIGTDFGTIKEKTGRWKIVVEETRGRIPVMAGAAEPNIDMIFDEFFNVCDKFTNKRLFRCDNRGNLIKRANGQLRPLFSAAD